MTDKWHPRKGIINIIASVWRNILIFVLFALVFYAGMITGMYKENRENSINDGRLTKVEERIKEVSGRMTALEATARKK